MAAEQGRDQSGESKEGEAVGRPLYLPRREARWRRRWREAPYSEEGKGDEYIWEELTGVLGGLVVECEREESKTTPGFWT